MGRRETKRSIRSTPRITSNGVDPGLPAQRATGARDVHREGKLAAN
jgi:hypothetical protein